MADVTAILPVFGHPELTRAAIAGLRRQSAPPTEIIVVDDGSAEPFGGEAGVRVLRHEVNRGFAAAVNTGLRAVGTELAAIVNNDVTLAPEWLERLERVIFHQNADFACGKLYRPDGRIDGTFDLLCRGGLAWRAGAGREDGELWNKPQRIVFTSFTAVVGRVAVFLAGGGLDESYQTYYEDVEWSLRAAIHNKTGYFDPAATGVHTGGATAGVWSAFSARQLLRNHRRLAHQYLLPEFRREYGVARVLLRAHSLKQGRWPEAASEPVEAKERTGRLAEILQQSEKLLYGLQMAGEPDRLWRWYFQLAGGGS